MPGVRSLSKDLSIRFNKELILREGVLLHGTTKLTAADVDYIHVDLKNPSDLVVNFFPRGSQFSKLKRLGFDSEAEADAGCRWLTAWLIAHHGAEYRNALNEGAARLAAAVAAHTSHQLASYNPFDGMRVTGNSSNPPSPKAKSPRDERVVSFLPPPSPEALPTTLPLLDGTARSLVEFMRLAARRHRVEAVVFGVLMPLALVAYWLWDVDLDLIAHGGHWRKAHCTIHRMVMTHRTVHHVGKFSDQVGVAIELEPGWPVSVSLQSDSASPSWEAMAHSTVRDATGPMCEGEVDQPLAETISSCQPFSSWIPTLYEPNATADCFVHRAQQQQVYFTLDEPPSFYLDFVAISFCLCIVASILWCLLSSSSLPSLPSSMPTPSTVRAGSRVGRRPHGVRSSSCSCDGVQATAARRQLDLH